jgi:hypothetical protein
VLRSALVVLLALALLLTQALPAAACSVGPDWHPRDHTQLLVLGRARSIELGPSTRFGYVEATVTLEVIEVFRGTASSPLRFVDSASVISAGIEPHTGKQEFVGSGGGCGTIDDDPVGMYVLIALAKRDDARWHANMLYGAIYSAHPLDYAQYRWMLERHGVAVRFPITQSHLEGGPFGNTLAP